MIGHNPTTDAGVWGLGLSRRVLWVIDIYQVVWQVWSSLLVSSAFPLKGPVFNVPPVVML